MTAFKTFLLFGLVGIMRSFVYGLQRTPPRYSQQYMPQTSFTCRNKIVGSYYADSETDCQLFHVCVSVAGGVQDYRFLCPNDTAFDQESQTCADWYDVDCEAATLYYASDNFDLYRIGSGLESLHYDSIRSDSEQQDHLQRSESSDPVRSLNSYNSNNYNESEMQKKSNQRASNYGSEYTLRNQKHLNNDIKKDTSVTQESEKKSNIRKITRKPVNSGLTNTIIYSNKSTTAITVKSQNHYNDHALGYTFTSTTTTQQPSSQAAVNTQKYNLVTSTIRPITKQTLSTTRSTSNSPDSYSNYQITTSKNNFYNNFNNINRFETTVKPDIFISTYYSEPQSYSSQLNNNHNSKNNNNNSDNNRNKSNKNSNNNNNNKNNNKNNKSNSNNSYNNYDSNNNNNQNNNNIQGMDSTSLINAYDNLNNNYYNQDNLQLMKSDYNANTYTSNNYKPTTYSPVMNKLVNYNRQYYDKSTTLTTQTAQYTDSDSTKAQKKPMHYDRYQNYETSTRSYNLVRSSAAFGFSPSSINHLAENIRSTTPTSRRIAAPITYNPNNFNLNSHAPKNQQRSTSHQTQYDKSTTEKYYEESTARPKVTKKNDYDYAYYDNGPLEYDNIELEHVSSNKESVKIT